MARFDAEGKPPAGALIDTTVAGVKLRLAITAEAAGAIAFCRAYLGPFADPPGSPDADATLHIEAGPAGREAAGNSPLAVQTRLDPGPDAPPEAILAASGTARLVFDPAGGHGRMTLDLFRPDGLKPLFGLLWMYVAQALSVRQAVLVHAAGIACNGRGYLFFGDSGAGKSTLARLGRPDIVFSDDSPALFFREASAWIGPTPFDQRRYGRPEAGGAPPEPVPLAGMYFLHRDSPAGFTPMDPQDAMARIAWRHLHFRDYLPAPARRRIFRQICTAAGRMPCAAFHYRPGQAIGPLLGAGTNRRDYERSGRKPEGPAPSLPTAPAL